MKKLIITTIPIIIITIFINFYNTRVYADELEYNIEEKISENSGDWVKDALSDASNFFKGDVADTDDIGWVSPVLETIRSVIKAINNILLVLLAAISAVSLAIVGVRYLASGADPNQRNIAIKSLHGVFKGMIIGFGAYIIWRIAMGIVSIILGSF